MRITHLWAAGLLSLAAVASAQATTVAVTAGDGWHDFNVDDLLAPPASPLAWIDTDNGSLLSFTFAIGVGSVGTLTVVDAVTAGESFKVYANGLLLGPTSAPGSSAVNVGDDYDAALANPAFSRGVFSLTPGNYTITGVMFAAPDGINVTQGGLKLAVSAVPEPSTLAMLLAGVGAVAGLARRCAG